MIHRYYILNDSGKPEPVDLWTLGRWFATHPRQVAHDIVDGSRVSTVFVGFNQQWIVGGPPLIFETLVFGGPLDGEVDRYSTRADALVGHAAMVKRVRAAFANKEGV